MPDVRPASPSRWNGSNACSRWRRVDARAAVDHAQVDRARRPRRASTRTVVPGGCARWRCRPGWPRPVRAAPGRPRRGGRLVGTSTCTPSARGAEAGERGRHDLVERDRRAARVARAPAWIRLMSSRLPTSLFEPVGLLVDGRLELGLLLGAPVTSCWRRLRDRRLDAGERRAQVVRHRLQQRGAQRVGLGQRGGRRRLVAQPAAIERRAELGGEGVQDAPVVGRQRAAAHDEEEVVVEAFGLVGLLRPTRCRSPSDASTAHPSPSDAAGRRPSRPKARRIWITSSRQRIGVDELAGEAGQRLGLGRRAARLGGAPAGDGRPAS